MNGKQQKESTKKIVRIKGENRALKYSTIGTSWITDAFIDAAQQSGVAELVSVYSRNEQKAHRFAEKHGAAHIFTDLQAMLTDESDVVYVASPNKLHADHIKLCIQNGKHVFCEKPMVYTVQQLEEIMDLARANDVFVFEGFRHLFSPNYKILKEQLLQIGVIRSAMFQYVKYSSKYDQYKEGKDPNIFSKTFAGGALMDLGVYPLSMAIDLFGQPEKVNYFPVLLSNGIDGSGTIVLTYKGFIVTILCSKIANASLPSEIHGEDGSLTMDSVAPISDLQLYDRIASKTTLLASQQYEADMIYEIQAFEKMLKGKDRKWHDACLERSRIVVQITEQLRKENGILFPGES